MWWFSVSLFLLGPLVAMVFGVWIFGAIIFYAGAVSLGFSSLKTFDVLENDRALAWVIIGLGLLSALAVIPIYLMTL